MLIIIAKQVTLRHQVCHHTIPALHTCARCRCKDIQKLADNEQEHIFITLDALIRDFKNKKAYAS